MSRHIIYITIFIILESKENGEYPELSKERRRELEIEKREVQELVEAEKRRHAIETFKKSKIK